MPSEDVASRVSAAGAQTTTSTTLVAVLKKKTHKENNRNFESKFEAGNKAKLEQKNPHGPHLTQYSYSPQQEWSLVMNGKEKSGKTA